MRIGIFGGSFNPSHIGHAIIASHILQNSTLEQIWFMVAPQNPLKTRHDPAIDIHRIRMTELVTRHIPGASTSAFEFNLPQPSFTISTLQQLSLKFPQHKFALIIGADNWQLFHKWKDYETILANYEIFIYPRLGYEILIPEHLTTVHQTDAPIIQISSTQIRQDINHGKDVRFLVSEDVYNYIKKHNLYTK